MIQKLKRQEELLKRQIELEKEVQQKRSEDDEKKLSEKKGWNKPRSRKESREKDQQESEFRTNSPPIPTMRQKETDKNDKENKDSFKKVEQNVNENKVAANRFQNSDGLESSQSIKSRGNPEAESAAVVAQLQTMRQVLERKKKMLKDEDVGSEG